MEGSFSDDYVHEWLQQVSDAAYVSLHYDTPALGSVGANEIHGGGYARTKVAFTQPANRVIWSMEDAVFTGLTQNQITHFGIWNQGINGRLICYGRLPTPAIITTGQGYVIYEGEIALSFG